MSFTKITIPGSKLINKPNNHVEIQEKCDFKVLLTINTPCRLFMDEFGPSLLELTEVLIAEVPT